MADPFELRLFFSNRLRALNPCEDNTEEVVSFALKHRDLDEDLWSCVLEQLSSPTNSINVRANIFYFLEDLVELSLRREPTHRAYVRMVERDFVRMVDAVIPVGEEGGGLGLGVVNVNCVRYVLHALHFELGVFARTAEEKGEHDKALGQVWETRCFDELEVYLEQRAKLARPEFVEMDEEDGDAESEVDMSWVERSDAVPVLPVTSEETMDVDGKQGADGMTVATTLEKNDQDIVMADPHDLPSPPGTRSPSDTSTPLRTPVPPTPPSPSPSPVLHQQVPSNTSPSSAKPNGLHSSSKSPTSTTINKIFSPVNPSSTSIPPTSTTATNMNTTAPRPVPGAAATHSPTAFTPVQKEDAIIFAQQYFELATERMEQDRERQRRKEDSSGFVAVVAGTVDDEVAQILGTTGKAQQQQQQRATKEGKDKDSVWLEDLVAERVVWGEMGE